MMASTAISREPNQSSSSPRSNRTCRAPIARLRVPKPNQSSFAVPFACRLGQKCRQAEEGKDADRQVDVEDIAPAIGLGQPAAEHGPQDGTGHHRDAPKRHGGSLPLLRIDVEQDGLRERDERRAEHALQDPEQHDLDQRLRHAAQHRGDGEAGDGEEEEPLEPEPSGEVAGRRRHDRGGDDVRGQHPGDLVLTGRDATLHVGQRHVGDGRVERLHEGGEDHADGDRRPVASGWRALRRHHDPDGA